MKSKGLFCSQFWKAPSVDDQPYGFEPVARQHVQDEATACLVAWKQKRMEEVSMVPQYPSKDTPPMARPFHQALPFKGSTTCQQHQANMWAFGEHSRLEPQQIQSWNNQSAQKQKHMSKVLWPFLLRFSQWWIQICHWDVMFCLCSVSQGGLSGS